MQVGCSTFAIASSALPSPAAALASSHCRGTSIICQPNHPLSSIRLASYSDSSQITSSTTSRSKGNLIVRAINQRISTRNWDVSNYAAPSWLPRFEELDTTNMLLRQRIIFLGTQIDDMTADFVISQLLLLDAEDQQKDIKLFINSPGGSVTAGMGIYDAMKLCKADVSTICMGLAASMGAFLLASGTKGKRFCMPNARVMIHQPLGTAGGKATEMSIRIREMAYHKIKLNKILSRATGKSEQQIELDTDRDNFMNAWEAKEYGLVDEVIDDGKPGLVAPIAAASPPPKTRLWGPWKIEGSRKGMKNLPSEEKLSKNGYAGGQGKDDDTCPEQQKEEPSPAK
ncbi:ATP-dependent Clp protease proteolytic subunit 3, chloroplastic [Dorcoceras hygrometricum]|uniref:ATP-dependent Clp protease proteolytic subunit n=1 Tax=Dorcoceras hygrometricum TaxID=472368 RepID=A0A2Z7CLF4_9LAMI|nr:ATP-dependent Clp protease proteolytic subunit 3, chloroplastic [Dorcoceras hygrometricum]